MVAANLASSASAPELGSHGRGSAEEARERAKLQRLLAKATLARRKPPGGAPFVGAPPLSGAPPPTGVAASTRGASSAARGGVGTTGTPAPAASSAAVDGLGPLSRHATGAASQSRLGTGATQRQWRGTTGQLTPRSSKAALQVQQLLGSGADEKGVLHWRLVQELDAVDGLMHDDQERLLKEVQKRRNMADLKQQVEQARMLDDEARQSAERWGNILKADTALWEQEERRKRQQNMEALRRHNEEQGRIAEDMRRRRQEQQQADAKLEEEMQRAADEGRRRQQELDADRKRRQQEVAMQIAAEARAAMERKALVKKEEAARDLELFQQQRAMLEEQERQRHAYFDHIREKQNAKAAKYEAGAGNELAQRLREDEERALKCQKERALREEEEHRKKAQRLKQMQQEGVDFIQKQREEQARQREREREENRMHRQEAERDAEAAAQEDKRREQERRERAKEHQEYLRRQMLQQPTLGKFGHDQMTEVEQSINRDRLERAKDPESLQLLFKSKQNQYRALGRVAA